MGLTMAISRGLSVNAGEKMHRRAGVKMHHGGGRTFALPNWLSCSIDVSLLSRPRSGLRPALSLLALLEAVAVAVHFEDVDVVRQPVEQRAG